MAAELLHFVLSCGKQSGKGYGQDGDGDTFTLGLRGSV